MGHNCGVREFHAHLGSISALGVTAVAGLIAAPSIETAIIGVAIQGGLNFLEGQLLTPMIVGKRLALDPIVVSLSVAFWGWLWGIAGALMAIPILLTLRVIGTKLDSLRPLQTLLGSTPDPGTPDQAPGYLLRFNPWAAVSAAR